MGTTSSVLTSLCRQVCWSCTVVLTLTPLAIPAGSPGVQMGQSEQGDMQQVGSAGRQVDQVLGYIQAAWTDGDQFSLSISVKLKDIQVTGGPSPLELDNGESISVLSLGNSSMSATLSGPLARSRIANLRILPNRRGVVVFHEVASAYIAADLSQGLGVFVRQSMPNPAGCDTTRFVKHALDLVGADTIVHAVGTCRTFFTSTFPFDITRQTEYYWRGRLTGPSASVVWSSPVPVDSLFPLTAIVEASPVSNDVAIVYVNSRPGGLESYDNDLYCRRSTDGGQSWGAPINITNYGVADHERAYTDVTAVYDNDNTLHVAYNTRDTDTLVGLAYTPCKLWHWNSQRGTSRLVAVADWWNTCSDLSYDRGGEWNLQITKPTLTIKPAGAGPGGGIPGEVVYLHWVQFGPTAVDCATRDQLGATGGFVNGEIYGASSSDNGLTWDRPRNMTGTVTPNCLPGDCRSEHWVTAAARADSGIFLSYVEDKHAGATTFSEGYPATSPIRVLAAASRPATADPRIALDPNIRPYHSVVGDHYDVDVVTFTDRTSSFGLGIANIGTATLNFTATVLPDNGGTTHVRINGGGSYSSSIAAAGAENVATVDFDGIGLSPGQTYRLWTLRIVSNDVDRDTILFHLSVTVKDPTVSILGAAFNDLDGDGVWDTPVEPGLPDWVIHAEPGGHADTTDLTGYYFFFGLPAGTYTVSEVSRPGWARTYPGGAGTHVIALAAGEQADSVNFGNQEATCPITMTGDINVNGAITSADIIGLVNYVFKGGPPPLPCTAAGDVNCNGSVTSADVIALVNFVFKGGTAPCDGCTSPLAAEC